MKRIRKIEPAIQDNSTKPKPFRKKPESGGLSESQKKAEIGHLIDVAIKHRREGRYSDSTAAFRIAISIVKILDVAQDRRDALAGISYSQAEVGFYDAAIVSAMQILDSSKVRNPATKVMNSRSYSYVLLGIVNILKEDGEAKTREDIHDIFKTLYAAAEKVHYRYDEGYTTIAIVETQARFGFIERARDKVDKITHPRVRAYSLAAIASALFKANRKEEAVDTMARALSVAHQIPYWKKSINVIDEILRSNADVMLEYEKKWS